MSNNVYLDFVRRWFWLIAIGVIIAVLATNIALDGRVLLYQSTATVQVGRVTQDSRPDQSSLSISEKLVPIYAALAKRDPVLNATIDSLGLPYSAALVRSQMVVSLVPGTQLIDIHVVNANPEVASAIANEIARQLVLQSPGNTEEDERQQFVLKQLNDLEAKITAGQANARDLEEEISGMTSAAEIADAQMRLQALQAQVDAWQQSYTTLLQTAEPSKTNFLEIIDVAVPATAPNASPSSLYYGLGVVVGGGSAAALALALSVIFSAIRRPDDLRPLVSNVPVTAVPYLREIRKRPLISALVPASPTAAAYRVLRNTLQTEWSKDTPVSIAVFSSRQGEGKSTTIANLAVVLASVRRNVMLVDANVRNPSLDQMFGTDTSRGLSDVVLGDCSLADAIQPTAYPTLSILGAGSVPGNYADILSPERVRSIVQSVTSMADITLIDTPSIQEESEALLLAREVDAALVIVEAGRLRSHEVERMLEALTRSGVTILSITLNKSRMNGGILSRLPFSRDAKLRRSSESRRLARNQSGLEIADRRDAAVARMKHKRSKSDANAANNAGRSKSA